MTALLFICKRLLRRAAHHGIRHHRWPRRIGRIARRTAGIAASKPAAVAWVCAVIGGGGWLAGGIPAWSEAGMAAAPSGGGVWLPNGVAPVVYLPPEAFAEQPHEFFAPVPLPSPEVEIIGPVPLLPELPAETPQEISFPPTEAPVIETPQPVPEPSSALLLASAVAAFIAWRRA